MINAILIILIFALAIVLILYAILKIKNEETEEIIEVDDKTYTLDKMTNFIKKRLDEITKINLYDIGLSEEELKRRKNKKYELKKALKGCTYGDSNDKKYVKELMYDILYREYGVDETNISKAITFDVPSLLSSKDKFDIIIYMYKNNFGNEALTELIKKYNLADLRYIKGITKPSYVITKEDIDFIFEKENFVLAYEDKLKVLVQRIYENYKGYSVIDEIREMNIDGVSRTVYHGLPESFITQISQSGTDYLNQVAGYKIPRACDSIWIFFQGKSIRLEFLSFGTESELKRVCQNIYKYNNPGQLSDTNGFKINEMKDGSRVVVVRPSFAESWAFFVRKFDVKKANLEELIIDEGKENVIDLIKFLVKGARVVAITGEQASGKTTMLMAMIENIYETMNIRVQETAFELHLRKIYPTRNILTFRETESISGQMGLDVQKKTDGSVNIIGEVAQDAVAAWMIQACQVASKFTLFTHHAKTFPLLVQSLRNSLLKVGVFNDEKIAEEQVVGVLNFDIHLVKDFKGRRYIERITECIPLEDDKDYKINYKYVNILEYHDGNYVLTNPISEANLIEMKNNMDSQDAEDFEKFCLKKWRKRIVM